MISALISGLSLVMLTFTEFHPATSEQSILAGNFLAISIVTSVTSVMISTILLFGFEGYKSVRWNDLALAWTPLIILDCSIFAFIGGVFLWCMDNLGHWCIVSFGPISGILFLMICWAAINTYLIFGRTSELKERKST